MDLGLADCVYLVTGGSRGLGFAAARALVAEGARVVISGRDPDVLQSSVGRLGSPRATAVAADNAVKDTPERLVGAALERWDRLDGALIGGGGPPAGSVMEVADDVWRDSFESVFLGAVRTARVVSDNMTSGGSIAFVLSTSARSAISGLDISNGLRPGLAMLVKSMAMQLGPRGIRVNGLLPGRITTERTAYVDANSGPLGGSASRTASIPLGRAGEPCEFGRVATFVLSRASSYVSGAMIPIDGGATPGY